MPVPLRRGHRRLALVLFVFAPIVRLSLQAQISTGVVEGVVRGIDGKLRAGAAICITGPLQWQTSITTDSKGEYSLVLPYGEYRFQVAGGNTRVYVHPLQTVHVDLVIQAGGDVHADESGERDRRMPELTTLQGILLNQEPASVIEPIDFTGLRDNRVGVASRRGQSWTTTQFRLLGMDATDSYQPGRPVIVPDVQIMDVVIRSDFAETASTSYGTEIDIFPKQPDALWHGALATADTGGFLSASNLPLPAGRGIVEQADRFRWFTRDSAEAGGPITKWADLYAIGAAQWSLQAVPLASPGTDQRSRLLWGDVRSRIRASGCDDFDVLYSGSRINMNNWALPDGMEPLVGWRSSPEFDLPGGFDGQSGVSHFDFLQAGWTHRFSEKLGWLQARYGYSVAHVDADPLPGALGQSSVDLATGIMTGRPPMFTRSIRTRQGIEGVWQPGAITATGLRHQIALGTGWKSSSPWNRVIIPNNADLITVNGAPSEVVEFATPTSSRSIIRSFDVYAADHVRLGAGLVLDAGISGDFSRGGIPASGSGQYVNNQPAIARSGLITWNSVSPRAGLAWRVPHASRLILRGSYLRLYSPLAGRYLDFGNPNSLNGNVYQWMDANSNGRFEAGERGALLTRFGGAYSSISPSLRRPYADEFDLGAELTLTRRTFASIQLFRRDDKQRIAAVDMGVPPSAFHPVTMTDPGPDGIIGTFDDRHLIVYDQNPATLGQDRYLLTNPARLRTQNAGFVARLGGRWRDLTANAAFTAEKTYGPTNPGNAVFENDPGVIGALYLDPNTTFYALDRSFTDRAYVGKMQVNYTAPAALGSFEAGSTFVYMDGLLFRRELLIAGLVQGPFLLPAGDNRAQYAADWNLRIGRTFHLAHGRIETAADIFNVINAGRKIQENDISGLAFNQRLPLAIQEPRQIRLLLRYEF